MTAIEYWSDERHRIELAEQRAATIEECARVAETFAPNINSTACKGIADAIRALKDT